MRIGGWFGSPGGGLLLLFVIAVAGLATGLIFPGPSDAQNEAAASPSPAKVSAQAAFPGESAAAEPAPAVPAPADTPAAVPPETLTAERPPRSRGGAAGSAPKRW